MGNYRHNIQVHFSGGEITVARRNGCPNVEPCHYLSCIQDLTTLQLEYTECHLKVGDRWMGLWETTDGMISRSVLLATRRDTVYKVLKEDILRTLFMFCWENWELTEWVKWHREWHRLKSDESSEYTSCAVSRNSSKASIRTRAPSLQVHYTGQSVSLCYLTSECRRQSCAFCW